MSVSSQRELQRLRYRQGQMLQSRDFTEQQRIESELTAWHNRGLHNAYGVAREILSGLAVAVLADNSGVTVESGLAYDAYGRPLFIHEQKTVPFPDDSEPAYLVISHGDTSMGHATGVCCSSTAANSQGATLSWVPIKQFSVRAGVALAQILVTGGSITLKSDFVLRQARALARPRIASGTTIPGATSWERWDVSDWLVIVAGVQVKIDTSSAGFTSVPVYFASLQGELTSPEFKALTLHLDHIDEVTPNSFVFRVAILPFVRVPPGPFEPADLRKFLVEQKTYVSWLAIEPNAHLRFPTPAVEFKTELML